MTKQFIQTEHHVIEFDSKKTYKKISKFCIENGFTLDYWLFEFDLTPNDEEYLEEVDTFTSGT